MLSDALVLLILLMVKHWFIDFVNQSQEEVDHKGIYMDWRGVKHSLKHGIATMLCLNFITGPEYIPFALILSFFDFVAHYHIDYIKMHFGSRDTNTKAFWIQMGFDQLAHQLTYIALTWAVMQ